MYMTYMREQSSCLGLSCAVYILFDGGEGNMAGYCTSVQPYYHEPQVNFHGPYFHGPYFHGPYFLGCTFMSHRRVKIQPKSGRGQPVCLCCSAKVRVDVILSSFQSSLLLSCEPLGGHSVILG